MSNDRPVGRAKAIFDEAAEIASTRERAAYLDRACGADQDLRRKVDTLLQALDAAGSFLEGPSHWSDLPCPETAGETAPASFSGRGQPAENPAFTDVAADHVTRTFGSQWAPGSPFAQPNLEGPGSLIGRYKLREEIGEGGMGSVYLAEQLQPVKRHVALKLIKAGMDSKIVLARFESERQALALMEHPNIAKVLDAGTTDTGRPFFVMELVKGIPLTDYCDQHRLGLLERLTLFRQICSAVQHAHQKGIIHRDLKPSNILVESHDGHAVPKVIDFGLAKATGGLQLSEHSLHSAFGTVAGTPLYMAPEQASFNALDIDTRADIYALGVILYELLTGSTPIDRDTFKKAALDEMLRLIREVEPPTPSSRISGSGARARIATIRQTEPARLGRFVRGDLDWIVMKALAKEPQRRYESPIAFAHDIERFLNHEPVSAGPPTAAYRFKKFVRRHRVPAVAASIVLLTLIVGIVGTTLGLIEATRQEGIADFQREKAQERLAEIQKINGRLSESVRRETKANANLTAANSLVEARFNLAMEAIKMFHTGVAKDVLLKNDNLKPVRDRLLNDAAGFYKRLEGLLSQQADRKSRRALAQAYGQMGDLAGDIGATDRAVASYRHALEVIRELGEGEEADDDAEAGEEAKYQTGLILADLGNLLRETGRMDEARTAYEETRTLLEILTRAHPNITRFQDALATSYNNIGNVLHATGKPREALESQRMAQAIWQKLVDANPNDAKFQTGLGMSFHNIGHLLREAGNWREALASYESERMIFQRLVDANPADAQKQIGLARAHHNIGLALGETGRRGQALVSYQTERAIFQKLAVANPAVTRYQFELALSHFNIGGMLGATGKPGMALASFESARALLQKLVNDNPTFTDFQGAMGACHGDIAKLQSLTGKTKEALDSYQAARAIQQKLVDANPAITRFQSSLASTHNGMGILLKKTGNPEEALVSNRAARAIVQKLVDANPTVTSFRGQLADYDMIIGSVLSEIGKSEEALASYQSARALQQKLADANPAVTAFQTGLASSLIQTAILLKELGKQEEALMSCKAARAIKQALLDANPTGPFEQINLANVDLETGDILRLIGRPVEARASFERALAIIERLNNVQPTFADHSVVYQVFGLKGLGATQQNVNQTADAVASWRRAIAKAERLRSPSNELLFYLAGCHARLGAIAGMAGSGLSASEGQAELERAIVGLRQAIAGGYRNVNSMKRDLDLEGLRAQPDFQSLIMDLEFPAEPFSTNRNRRR